ncbi:TPA: hypothetical protein AB5H59_004045 [Vibrio mimicus]
MKSWIFSVIGGALILGSSAISGLYVTDLESKSSDEQQVIESKKIGLQQANVAYSTAITQSDLASITRSIVRHGVHQNESTQKIWDGIHAGSLNVVILGLRASGNLSLDDTVIAELRDLVDRVQGGDNDAYEKLQNEVVRLIKYSASYRSNLVLEIAQLEVAKSSNDQAISRAKSAALFVQLLGLVILLLKEIPIKKESSIPEEVLDTERT